MFVLWQLGFVLGSVLRSSALIYSTAGNGFCEWSSWNSIPRAVTHSSLCFQKTPQQQEPSSSSSCVKVPLVVDKGVCLSVIADMCHHWRNIYCSWDPGLLHFHSIRGLEEDPAGQNAVAVKLYPRLQGQEQRLTNLPLPVFVFIFYLIESVCFSLIRLVSEDIFNKSKKSPCISELWEGKIIGIRVWIPSPQRGRLKCHLRSKWGWQSVLWEVPMAVYKLGSRWQRAELSCGTFWSSVGFAWSDNRLLYRAKLHMRKKFHPWCQKGDVSVGEEWKVLVPTANLRDRGQK